MVEPYKGRPLDPNRSVRVYRNLTKRGGVWYSVKQDGRVVGHTQSIRLKNCFFVVNQSGRRRVIETGRKNVHAYVMGVINEKSLMYDLGESLVARYNPRRCASFEVTTDRGVETVLESAGAELDSKGLRVWLKRA